MENPKTFHYLNQSNCYKLDGIDDSKEYIATRRAMEVVGISVGEQVFHRKLLQLESNFKYNCYLKILFFFVSYTFSGSNISCCGCNSAPWEC